MTNNKTIRLQIIKKRWSIKPNIKTKLDHIIYTKTLNYILSFNPKKYIALYWPIENEVDSIALIYELINRHYKICLPYIHNNKMVFKPIHSIHFEYEYWKNMRQPKNKTVINGDDIELMIVPLIGFNKTNHRLGYGFNYYNDFLHWYNRIRTIGIAYNFQNNDEFTVSRYDKILNKIITDET